MGLVSFLGYYLSNEGVRGKIFIDSSNKPYIVRKVSLENEKVFLNISEICKRGKEKKVPLEEHFYDAEYDPSDIQMRNETSISRNLLGIVLTNMKLGSEYKTKRKN